MLEQLFLTFVGPCLLIGGVIALVRNYRFTNSARQINGVVTGTDDEWNSKWNKYVHYPIVQYYLDGQLMTRRSHAGTTEPDYPVGKPVALWVQKGNPPRVRLNFEVNMNWIVGFVLMFLGMIWTILFICNGSIQQ